MKKRKVVWGTGLLANKFVGSLEIDDIDFFIDSNPQKWGKKFLGRIIKNPDEIVEWTSLYIYIQYNFYDEIAEELRKKGLVEGQHFVKYEEQVQIKTIDIVAECEESLDRIKKNIKLFYGKTICWCNDIAFNKGVLEYFNQMCKEDTQWVLASEAVWVGENETGEKSPFPFFVLPSICSHETYPRTERIHLLGEATYKEVRNTRELSLLAIHYRKQFPDLPSDYEYGYIYIMKKYMSELVELLKPKRIFIQLSFSANHRMLAYVCHEYHIPIVYTHPGVFPGTYSYDIHGEMGESLPAIHAEDFRRLPITENEIQYASKVWDFMFEKKLNRKIQPKTNAMKIIEMNMLPSRPIIFLAGQNDCFAGLVPYTDNSSKYHSPIFKSSVESAICLGEIAKEKRWNIIYKPHPMAHFTEEEKNRIPENVIIIERADINEIIDCSDVVITILSATAYDSLLRYTPTVMLGYNQLKSKGCTYDAFKKDEIVIQIEKAIKEGFTKEQQGIFLIHIAQLLKYYLYDDMKDREIRYGRPIPQTIEEVYELSNLLNVKLVEE